MTVITYINRTALPLAEYVNTELSKYYTYHLDATNANTEKLKFNELPIALSASIGQQFQIWYAQDLVNHSEDNNSGQTCLCLVRVELK